MNDLLVLGTLLAGPRHGYALKTQAGLIFGESALHNNLVYPLLRRFASRGWITRRKTPGKRGQARLEYSLTPCGREELLRRVSQFGERDAQSSREFRLRAGFFELLPPEARKHILETRKKALLAQKEKFLRIKKGMGLGTFGGEVVDFLRRRIQAELSWIARLHRLSEPGKRGKT